MIPRICPTRGDLSYCSPEWHWVNDGSWKLDLNLWLVLDGQGHVEMEDRTFTLRAGDCFVFRHRQPHRASHDPKRPVTIPWMVFHCLDGAGRVIPPDESSLPALHRRVTNLSFLAGLMERSIESYHAGRQDEATHWLQAALMEVLRQDRRPATTPAEQDQADQVEALCQMVRKNPLRYRRLDDLADAAGYTPDHLIRLFRKYQNITPGEFLIRNRIRTAAQLLRFSAHSVTQISQMVGYGDVYAFSKQFRQRIGQSPTQFRRADETAILSSGDSHSSGGRLSNTL